MRLKTKKTIKREGLVILVLVLLAAFFIILGGIFKNQAEKIEEYWIIAVTDLKTNESFEIAAKDIDDKIKQTILATGGTGTVRWRTNNLDESKQIISEAKTNATDGKVQDYIYNRYKERFKKAHERNRLLSLSKRLSYDATFILSVIYIIYLAIKLTVWVIKTRFKSVS